MPSRHSSSTSTTGFACTVFKYGHISFGVPYYTVISAYHVQPLVASHVNMLLLPCRPTRDRRCHQPNQCKTALEDQPAKVMAGTSSRQAVIPMSTSWCRVSLQVRDLLLVGLLGPCVQLCRSSKCSRPYLIRHNLIQSLPICRYEVLTDAACPGQSNKW